MKKITALLVIIIAMSLVTTACIDRQRTTPKNNPPDKSLEQPETERKEEQKNADEQEINYGVYPGDRAFDFELIDMEGNSVKLSDYRGKVVVLNFWQSTSAWCKKELPLLDQLYKTYKDGDLVVLAVNIGETSSEVSEIIEEKGFLFPVLLDQKADVAKRYLISGLPTNFIITRSGIISITHVGYMDYNQMENYAETAFEEE